MNRSGRLALVDHDDPVLPVVAQCRLLKSKRPVSPALSRPPGMPTLRP